MSIKHKHAPVQPGTKAEVQQHFAKDADLNLMVARHIKGAGRFGAPLGNPNATLKPQFLDLSTSQSYHEMLNTVTRIDQMFMQLPARLRNKHKNRPELLMQWLEDPSNTVEAVQLGLVTDPEVVAAVKQALHEAAAKKREKAEQQDLVDKAVKADEEAQPTHRKVRKEPEGD